MSASTKLSQTANAEQRLKTFKRHVVGLLEYLFPKIGLSQLATIVEVLEENGHAVTERTFADLAFLLTHPEDFPSVKVLAIDSGDDSKQGGGRHGKK